MIAESRIGELRTTIAQIALLSHVSAANLGQSAKSTDDDIGGRRPSGGIDRKDDREDGFALRSVDYFNRRLSRCHSEKAISDLLVEARACLEAWRRAPMPVGQEPEYGSPQWKRWVAESPLDGGTLARKFNVTRQYIGEVRRKYAA